MSSKKPVKKKIVVTDQKATPGASKRKGKAGMKEEAPVEMLFKRINFIYFFAGLILIAIGFILMAGGKMPSPEIWDESLIYSPRRIILAPIVILAGLGVVLFSIFKK